MRDAGHEKSALCKNLHPAVCEMHLRARASVRIYRLYMQACNLLLSYVVCMLNFSTSSATIGSIVVFLCAYYTQSRI
jgi:hypothetical protein